MISKDKQTESQAKEKPEKVSLVPLTKEEKLKLVASAAGSLNRQYVSPRLVQKLGKGKAVARIPCIPTNLATVDEDVIGCGGIPRGRIIEIYGPESAGKTAICLHIIACAQRQGGLAAIVDAE